MAFTITNFHKKIIFYFQSKFKKTSKKHYKLKIKKIF